MACLYRDKDFRRPGLKVFNPFKELSTA